MMSMAAQEIVILTMMISEDNLQRDIGRSREGVSQSRQAMISYKHQRGE